MDQTTARGPPREQHQHRLAQTPCPRIHRPIIQDSLTNSVPHTLLRKELDNNQNTSTVQVNRRHTTTPPTRMPHPTPSPQPVPKHRTKSTDTPTHKHAYSSREIAAGPGHCGFLHSGFRVFTVSLLRREDVAVVPTESKVRSLPSAANAAAQ